MSTARILSWLGKLLRGTSACVDLEEFSQGHTRLQQFLKPQASVDLSKKSPCIASIFKNWNSILKSNWFFDLLNLIFRNWKKIEWHSIFHKSSAERQGVCMLSFENICGLCVGNYSFSKKLFQEIPVRKIIWCFKLFMVGA